jgi:tRNA A37 threonylcarbamoyltransferase TsaD
MTNEKDIIFANEINELCVEKKMEYIDAVVKWCEDNGFEIEYAAALIKKNSVMMSKIEIEAEGLNYMKKTNRLPI